MSSEAVQTAAPPERIELTLSPYERRVLGVLVEKAKTTPDIYPLSVNALVSGCNQKSNRDPLLEMSDVDVEDILADLQKKGLVVKITGGRVERWRHMLYDTFRIGKVELAIVGELLLRGPQTEGELRGRASRMEPIDDLEVLRATLKPMAERGLVVYLTPEGRRGTTLTHGFHEPAERERLQSFQRAEPVEAPRGMEPRSVAAPVAAVQDARWHEAQAEIAELKTQVGELQAAVTDLKTQMAKFESLLS